MNKPILWERLRKIIDSCKTWEQCNVARNLIDLAAYDLMSKKEKNPYDQSNGYYSDLSSRLYTRRQHLEDIEDKKLLERMDAQLKSKKSPS